MIEKEDDIINLNNSIKSYKSQVDEKNKEIEELTKRINQYENNIRILKNDLIDLTSIKDKSESELKDKYDLLEQNKVILLNQMNNLNEQYIQINTNYSDIKVKYQTTIELLENKTKEYNLLSSSYDDINNQLNLIKEINNRHLKNSDMTQKELMEYVNENSSLKAELLEKNILLGELNKKLELETKKQRGYENEDNIIINKPIEKAIRGIKLSKR